MLTTGTSDEDICLMVLLAVCRGRQIGRPIPAASHCPSCVRNHTTTIHLLYLHPSAK